MVAPATLGLFLVAVVVLFLSPGPNMAFVLSHGAAHGARGGFAAALGIATADLAHSVFAATGVTAMLAAWPPAFDLIRYSGAAYLMWLALQAFRSPGKTTVAGAPRQPMWKVFRMAALNCLLNPKALLFFMVFLPQFVDARRGDVPLQMLVLGATLALCALVFNTALGACAARVMRSLEHRPDSARWSSWLLGGVLFGLALRLMLLERGA